MFGNKEQEAKPKIAPNVICPLLKERCGLKCAWLIEHDDDNYVCAITQIALNG